MLQNAENHHDDAQQGRFRESTNVVSSSSHDQVEQFVNAHRPVGAGPVLCSSCRLRPEGPDAVESTVCHGVRTLFLLSP